MIGETIAQYTILEKLGEGGMGVVYKAHDARLDRPVALKFLPPTVAATGAEKARFVQEARAASALNHPNVCTIYDIQEHEGSTFIVMEYVDGRTLREKSQSATINLKSAIEIGIQIADGLAAAHEKGIVHRDIKPENIMVRKDGIAQIMDFGLAKLAGVSRLTKEGSTVGTAGYMSPEQVQGEEADHRSDIFSLGVLLYEMFTGQLPFNGAHETAMTYEIVNVDAPPMSSTRPEIDPALDAIVLECLAKEPGERYQSVAEVSKELRRFKRESGRQRVSRISGVREVQKGSTSDFRPPMSPSPDPAAPLPRASRPWLWMGISAVLFLATVILVFLYRQEASTETSPVRFTISPPEKGAFLGQAPVISPDGQHLAYVARDSSGKSLIWVRPLSSFAAMPLTGTEEGAFPFWSPDSRRLGFFQGGKLKKIEAAGGPSQSLCDAPEGRGGTWSSAGLIVFAPSYAGGLSQVPEAGGVPTSLTTLDSVRREDSHRWPGFLPDGRHFLYLRRSVLDENSGVYLGSLDGGEPRLLLASRLNAVYAAPGYLLFVRERSLMVQPFDAGNGTVTGDAFPLVEDVAFQPALSFGFFSASMNGTLSLGMGGGAGGTRQLVWFDRSGKLLERVGSPGSLFDFALSPDEKRLVFRRMDSQTRNEDLWVLDLVRRTESRFTFQPVRDDDPFWSPDGRTIAFSSTPEGVANIHRKIATGAGKAERLVTSPVANYPMDWSADGKYILYAVDETNRKTDIWALSLADTKTSLYVGTDASEYDARFSPDVRWVAYASDESGKPEVYVQAFPATEGKWQVSVNGGAAPLWSKNGRELFYVSPDKKLMAVDVMARGSSFEQGIPKPLFEVDVDAYDAPNRYAVTADGKRFLVNTSTEGASARPIAVVLNWTAEARGK